MDPELWGKHAWYLMHRITMYYPTEPTAKHKQDMKLFFDFMQRILPCETCRDGFKRKLETVPLTDMYLSSR